MYKVNLMDMEIGVDANTPVIELIKKYSQEDYDITNIIACKINGAIKDLNTVVTDDCDITYIFTNSTEGMRIYVRGLTLILIKALEDLYPQATMQVDYSLGEALCCEIEGIDIIDEIVVALRKRMKEIIEQNIDIVRKIVSCEELQEMYIQAGFTEKAGLVKDTQTKSLSLYYIENTYGYFYGKMPITTSYIKTYDLKKYEKGVILMYPNRNDISIIKASHMNNKLYNTLKEYEDFYNTVGIKNIYDLNQFIREGKIEQTIMVTEAMHEKKLASIADAIKKNEQKKLILIAGPSSAGKTTFAQRLGIQLTVNNIPYITLSMDNYFVPRADVPVGVDGKVDYENINVVDIDYLNSDINKLISGEQIELPEFNFITGEREYNGNVVKLQQNGVIVLEGLHALNDDLTPSIATELKYKIFVSALTVLNVDNYNRISTTDTRLIRRIIRDCQFRNYTIEETMAMWETVRAGEDKWIFPFQENADVMFNTSLPFEFSIFKNVLEDILDNVPKTSEYYSETNRLKSLLSMFLPLDIELIPTNSILREFIGGGCFYR